MITFDASSKHLVLSSGTTVLDVKDAYSRWKDWVITNPNYDPVFISVGGNSIDQSAGTAIPFYGFLTNGWRVKPQEADHTLSVTNGILLVDGGGDPFVNTNGAYTVRVNYQQPVQAIAFNSEGGSGVTAEQISQAVWAEILESSYSAKDIIKLMAAVNLGLSVVNMDTKLIMFRSLLGNKYRVRASMSDDMTQRDSIELDPT